MIGSRYDFALLSFEYIIHLRTSISHPSKTHTIFKAFYSVYAQHRTTQCGMQLVEHRLAQPCRNMSNDTGNNTSHCIAF